MVLLIMLNSSLFGIEYYTPWSYNLKVIHNANGDYIMPQWSPNGNYIAFFDTDTLFVYEFNSSKYLIKKPMFIENRQMLWDKNSSKVIFNTDKEVYILDIKTKLINKIKHMPQGKNDWIDLWYCYDDGRLLINYNKTRKKDTVLVYSLKKNRFVDDKIKYPSISGSCKISPDGKLALKVNCDKIICYDFEAQKDRIIYNINIGSVFWRSDSKSFFTISRTGDSVSIGNIDGSELKQTALFPYERAVLFKDSPFERYFIKCNNIYSFIDEGPYQGWGGVSVVDEYNSHTFDMVWVGYYAEWSPCGKYIAVSTPNVVGIINWNEFVKKYRIE